MSAAIPENVPAVAAPAPPLDVASCIFALKVRVAAAPSAAV